MKTKIGYCKGIKNVSCPNTGKQVETSSGLCRYCGRARFAGYGSVTKGSKVKKVPKVTFREPTGELALFNAIWNSRPRVSFLSGKAIREFSVNNFAHVLRKAPSSYPKFKLYDKNIILLTPQEHMDFDNQAPSDLLRKDPRWEKVFTLKEVLKAQYKKLYER